MPLPEVPISIPVSQGVVERNGSQVGCDPRETNGARSPIPGRKFFIGRAEDCHLRPHSDLISRHHCVILVEEGFVAVRDFGSKNGTYVNGNRVTAEVELKSGDHLKVGQLEFEVRMDVAVGGKKLPKVHSVQEAAVRTVEKPRGQKAAKTTWMSVIGSTDDEASPMSDTATMDPTRTIRGGKTTPEEITAEEAPDAPVEEPNKEEEEPRNPSREDSKSSRDAASQGLKNLFRRF